MKELCDEVIFLPPIYKKGRLSSFFLKAAGEVYSFFTSTKFSNFIYSVVELTSRRVSKAIEGKQFELVLYEYWHAYKSTRVFKKQNIPCILDTHNILWQAFLHQNASSRLPSFIKNIRVD